MEKQHRFHFRLKRVKVSQASDTLIELVPFIWSSIMKGALKILSAQHRLRGERFNIFKSTMEQYDQ